MIALLIASLVLPLAAFQPVAQTPQAAQEARRQAAQQAEEKARAESQRVIELERSVLAPERRALEVLRERLGQEVDHERIAVEMERARAEVERILQSHAGDADWQEQLTKLHQQAQEMARQQELFQREFNVANQAELQAKIHQELELVARAKHQMMREMNLTSEAELKARLEADFARAARHAAEALNDEQLQKLLREVTAGTLQLGAPSQLQARKLELQRLLEQVGQHFSVDSAEMMELKARLAVIEKELAKIRQ